MSNYSTTGAGTRRTSSDKAWLIQKSSSSIRYLDVRSIGYCLQKAKERDFMRGKTRVRM